MGTPRARLANLAKNRKASWLKKGIVARVRHLRGEDKLRHATLQSLNPDKPLRNDLDERHTGRSSGRA